MSTPSMKVNDSDSTKSAKSAKSTKSTVSTKSTKSEQDSNMREIRTSKIKSAEQVEQVEQAEQIETVETVEVVEVVEPIISLKFRSAQFIHKWTLDSSNTDCFCGKNLLDPSAIELEMKKVLPDYVFNKCGCAYHKMCYQKHMAERNQARTDQTVKNPEPKIMIDLEGIYPANLCQTTDRIVQALQSERTVRPETEVKTDTKTEVKSDVKTDTKTDIKSEVKTEPLLCLVCKKPYELSDLSNVSNLASTVDGPDGVYQSV